MIDKLIEKKLPKWLQLIWYWQEGFFYALGIAFFIMQIFGRVVINA